ncbi:MAG: hypothetical protein F4X64_13160 [Chloroflexi bacterium]|nr:hypothetical protein [Chloroflexota bacterium]
MSVSLHVALDASIVIMGVDMPPMNDFVEKLEALFETDVQVLSGGAGDPDVLVLDRERIEVSVQGSRLIINRDYPSEEDLSTLARISNATLTLLDQSIEAIGYNVDLVFEQDSGRSAERYLGERLFRHGKLDDDDWPLWGGSGTMVFGSSQERKSFTVAPRLDDEKTTRVFVEANYHVAGGQTPLEAVMSESLATIWKDAFRVMELVDGEENL